MNPAPGTTIAFSPIFRKECRYLGVVDAGSTVHVFNPHPQEFPRIAVEHIHEWWSLDAGTGTPIQES